MAVSTIDLSAVSASLVHINTDVDETEDDVDSGAGTLYAVYCDNTGNAAVTYVKLYFAASGAVTVGTTDPNWVIPFPASVARSFPIPEGMAYSTALSLAAVTAAGTGGVTGPTSAVTVRLIYA